jgi:hypothetical protein
VDPRLPNAPSHGKNQIARNSKPWQKSNSKELQATSKLNSVKKNGKARAHKGHQCFDLQFWSGSAQCLTSRRLGSKPLE